MLIICAAPDAPRAEPTVSKLYGKLFWVTAGIVMISRVYIGVLYPSDVITGCILGCVNGLLVL